MTIYRMKSVGFITLLPIILAACSGSSSDVEQSTADEMNTAETQQPEYASLNSRTNDSSTLGGAGYSGYKKDGESFHGAAQVSGTLNHDTNEIQITVNDLNIIDEDGFDQNGRISNSEITLINLTEDKFDNHYEYVNVFQHNNNPYYIEGNDLSGQKTSEKHHIVAGIITNEVDVPLDGIATYSGEATGRYISLPADNLDESVLHNLNNGTSLVTVDFGQGVVTAELNNFDSHAANGEDLLIDEIIVRNMQITGNGFSGGDLEIYKDGAEIAFIDSTGDIQSHGALFGFDETQAIPDEVGGVIHAQDNENTLEAVFLAD